VHVYVDVWVLLTGDYTYSNPMLADIKIIPPQTLREDADLLSSKLNAELLLLRLCGA